VYSRLTSSGQLVGSMPIGTSLKLLSPTMGGLVSVNASLKLWVIEGARHDTRHLTMCILAKRWRTALTICAARLPPPSRTTLKNPPMSGFARFCMNSRLFSLNSW
jgi:hypothetical protein